MLKNRSRIVIEVPAGPVPVTVVKSAVIGLVGAAPTLRDALLYRCYEKGLLLLGCGESTVRLMPPLVVEQDHADFALDVLERCIAEAER